MRRAWTLVFLLLVLSLSPQAQMRLQPLPPPPPKLIRAGRVLDVKSGQYRLDSGTEASSCGIIRSSTIIAAELMGWSDRVGELAVGRFADMIAVVGDPMQDIVLLQHLQFVMKGATVVRNDVAKK